MIPQWQQEEHATKRVKRKKPRKIAEAMPSILENVLRVEEEMEEDPKDTTPLNQSVE